jgi:hypothetical protein
LSHLVGNRLLDSRKLLPELLLNVGNLGRQGSFRLTNRSQELVTRRPNARGDAVNSRLQGLVPRHPGRLVLSHLVGNRLLDSRKLLPKLRLNFGNPLAEGALSLFDGRQKLVLCRPCA